jgi:hypothetical protein
LIGRSGTTVPDGYARRIMAAKKCPKCGKYNPDFSTHCVYCSAPQVDKPRKASKTFTNLKIGLVLFVSILLIIYVFILAVQYSKIFEPNFFETVAAKSAAESQPIPEYPLNFMVENNSLQITIISLGDEQSTFNSQKYFIVEVFLKNVKTSEKIQISSNIFELIDSYGTQYSGYLIEKHLTFDLSPSQSYTTKVKFIIPQVAIAKKIRVTIPGTSAFASTHYVVDFVI